MGARAASREGRGHLRCRPEQWVSVVVPTRNSERTIAACLASIRTQSWPNVELIVVDNASTDGSAQLIRALLAGAGEHGGSCRFIASDSNLGAAGGRNLGWAHAGREFILSIDDDTFISAAAVAEMVACLRASPDVGAVFPRIRDQRSGKLSTDLGEAMIETSGFYEACFMIRRSLFARIGGIDERLFFGGEGLDYAIRVRSDGLRVVHLPAVEVLHNGLPRDPAASRRRRTRWLEGFVMIHHKHFPLPVALAFTARYTLASFASGVRACGPGILPGLARAAVSGLWRGRRNHRPVPPEVVRFYRNPSLRPDFGNEPLIRKLRRRIARGRPTRG